MNLSSALLRTRPKCIRKLAVVVSRSQSCSITWARAYATHRNPQSSSFSHTLDASTERQGPKHDTVGPFRLGLAQPMLEHGPKVRKWSELSTGGKVMRTTARTTNLGVILLGAGLSALLIYSLTTELFSKNSPTVIFNQACEKIKASPQVLKVLNGPLSFHNQPRSSTRPRHRNRHVSSQIMVDHTGREHMLMNFYVEGRPEGAAPSSEDASYLDSITHWTREHLDTFSGLTWDEVVAWSRESATSAWERSRSLFKYLSGEPVAPARPHPTMGKDVADSSKEAQASSWTFGNLFSSIRGVKGGSTDKVLDTLGSTKQWTEGEVHAELIRDDEGLFVFRYLFIDLPHSRGREKRIFVERAPNVRDNEPILRWTSSS